MAVHRAGLGGVESTRALRHTVRPTPTVVAALTALAVAGVAAVVGAPVMWLVASLVAIALTLGQGGRASVESLPAAAVLLVATTVALLLGAGLAGVGILEDVAASRAVLVVGGVTAMGLAWRATSHLDARSVRPWTEFGLVAAPAALMLGLFVVVLRSDSSHLSWFLSGDHLRHLGVTTRTLQAGTFEYSALSYPHGWHALMAAMWKSTGSVHDGAGLWTLVTLQAAATWVMLTLVPLALSLIAARLARARGLGPVMTGVSALVAGAMILGPMFYGEYVPRGFDTTLLVLLVLVAAVHAATVVPESDLAFALALAATFVIAHSWQVLLVPACLLTVLVLWRRRLSGQHGYARARDLLAVGACVLASLPGVLAALTGYGIGAVDEAGDVPPPAIGWFVAVVLSMAVVSRRGERGPIAILALGVGGAFLTSVSLAWVAGVGLNAYYPSKTLWVAAAIGLPALAVLVGIALFRLDNGSPVRRAGYVVLGAGASLLVALSTATPVMGVAKGAWGGADADAVMRMVTSDAAPTAAVIWRASNEVDDATGQLLLDFYRATAQTPLLGLAATEVEEQCVLLRATARATVISTAPASEVRARFACAPGVEVVAPPGP